MLIQPQTLSIITTHQCTAACDNCCFTCTPKVKKAIPVSRISSLIDEISHISSMQVVVFTGGECFLLRKNLDMLIEQATKHGFITRCVTNGYWATSRKAAIQRINEVKAAGLREINLSTGSSHAKYVPIDRIVHAAYASAQAGLTTLINIEIFNESDFPVEKITKNPDLIQLITMKKVTVQRNVWINNAEGTGKINLTHRPENSRFTEEKKSGCSTVLNVIAVTPDQHLVACCGLHMESIPELHLGSIANNSVQELLDSAHDDLLKIWIHLDGPERVLEFVKKHIPDYELPVHSVHPCTTCLHLYTDEKAKALLLEKYKEIEDDLVDRYLATLAIKQINNQGRNKRQLYLSQKTH